MRVFQILRASVVLAWLTMAGAGCMDAARHEAAMAKARHLRGQTAYDGRPSFGEPYGEWGREKLSNQWDN